MKKYFIALAIALAFLGMNIGVIVHAWIWDSEQSVQESNTKALEVSDVIIKDTPAPESKDEEPIQNSEKTQDSESNDSSGDTPVNEPEKSEETLPVSYEKQAEPVKKMSKTTETVSYSGSAFKRDGVWSDSRFTYTWYSSKALYHYRTGEWHINSEGIYEDSNGYIVVASSDYSEGTVITDTLFGTVKVYDSGCPSGVLDVYVSF